MLEVYTKCTLGSLHTLSCRIWLYSRENYKQTLQTSTKKSPDVPVVGSLQDSMFITSCYMKHDGHKLLTLQDHPTKGTLIIRLLRGLRFTSSTIMLHSTHISMWHGTTTSTHKTSCHLRVVHAVLLHWAQIPESLHGSAMCHALWYRKKDYGIPQCMALHIIIPGPVHWAGSKLLTCCHGAYSSSPHSTQHTYYDSYTGLEATNMVFHFPRVISQQSQYMYAGRWVTINTKRWFWLVVFIILYYY